MSQSYNRRRFLGSTAAGGLLLGTAASGWAAGEAPSNRLRVGVMGMGGRGSSLARQYAERPGVDVAYVCDVDRDRLAQAVKGVGDASGKPPEGVTDFRRILDDDGVDILVIATANHWHAPATILACSAGKHVYVEKPGSHNPREGEWMVEAARRYDRRVQQGTQRRSWEIIREAVARLQEGVIGEIRFVRGWYNNQRASIGYGQPADPPERLDWDLWQGPAPRVPYRDNIVHYNWHWFWHWGNGEIGNNGIHALDVCLMGLNLDRHPVQVTAGGGNYFLDDDRDTPDSLVTTYDYGDLMITWEGRSAHRRGFEGSMFGMVFYGTEGAMVIPSSSYAIYDRGDKLVEEKAGSGGDALHIDNFLAGVREGTELNAEVGVIQRSTLLCHLGNIAYRTGRALRCDPVTGHIQDDDEAAALWSREYEPGWEPELG